MKGLLKHDDGKTLQTIVKVLKDLGYNVAYKILRAQYLDVPQKRERLIILAVRKDLKLPFLFPKEADYTISIKEALKKLSSFGWSNLSKKKKEILDLIPRRLLARFTG